MLKILIAEDNPGDVLLVKRALKHHAVEHELTLVRDGEEALELITQFEQSDSSPPDVVLLDLNLPRVDGPEILRALRNTQRCAATPVIVVTSSDSPADRARVMDLGVSHYFRKPSDLQNFLELGAIVKELLAN